ALPSEAAKPVDPKLLEGLQWREVGPYRGGRSAAVEGLPSDRNTYYFGSVGGGVWKTTNGGRTWKPVSDGFFGGSIGAVAVSETDPNVVYVGTGEKTVRGNVSHGDGVWKSTDAGKTWTHVGLPDSRHIPRVRIHPRDPDLVYAAVLGHLFGPNKERGVYRSRNGGKTWERILFVNENAGAVDLILDPTNPRILYASTWRVRRTPYSLESGGPGSALWKSTDGGDTWLELTKNPGMPKGTLGIIGVSVSPTNPENVYASIEAEEGGVFRSRDGGRTWTRTSEDRNLRQRAWYYSRIYADPRDEDVVYVVNVQFHRSKDGGKTFTTIRVPHGDNHDLWIDPADPLRMIESNDGGANVSYDGGQTWTGQENQPTAQMYRVSLDNDFPYRLLGGQQDNSALRIRSRSTTGGGIGPRDFDVTAGGESGHVVADPQNPDIVYGGSYGGLLVRLNHDTGEAADVNVWPDDPMGAGAADLKYRFQWNFPILFSPHDPDTLYAAGNVLFRSTTEGQSWEAISGDLTRNDKSKMGPSGGPITKDNTSVEYYGTIFAVAESPLEKGTIWAGSDDGLVHVTRDAGKSWKNVTPKGMPEWMLINSIDAHPFEKGGLYVAGTKYKSDDFRPYLYRTTDYGATWTRIDKGIDPLHFTRVIRADPVRRGLLYAGTERGMYVSFDDGGNWQPLQLNLPIVPITDLAVRDDELVAATQGRSYWILNGLTNLRQLPADRSPEAPHLFEPAPAYRLGFGGGFDPGAAGARNMGTNPPGGAVIYYFLDKAPSDDAAKEAKLEILDRDAKVIRTFSGKPAGIKPAEKAEPRTEGEEEEEEQPTPPEGVLKKTAEGTAAATQKAAKKKDEEEIQAPMEAGLNRFVWDLSYPKGKTFPGMILWSGDPVVPFVLPGDYQVRLTVGGVTRTAPLKVVKNPRSSLTQADLEEQHRFVMDIRAKLDEMHDTIRQVRDVRAQLDDLKKRVEDEETEEQHAKLLEAAKALDEKMTKVEEALYQTKNRSQQDPLNFPIRLNDKLNALANSASGFGDAKPTAQAVQVKEELTRAIDAELAKLAEIFAKDLPALNEMARNEGVATVILSPSRLK
ncbi:MAG TPA: glycosyl hydrolase, partial [Thermoanaerobaculia bacterium]|nr:glycosyl hydrolase [Thermoanaerobaculia bacterium]